MSSSNLNMMGHRFSRTLAEFHSNFYLVHRIDVLVATIPECERIVLMLPYGGYGSVTALRDDAPERPTSLTRLEIYSRSLKAVPNHSSLTNLVDLSLLNGGDHDDYGHNPQVPTYMCDRLDQLSRLRDLRLSCPNPSLLSLLPPGLEVLSLYHSTSLSCWERLSYLGRLSTLRLCKSISSEIRLDGLESLTNLWYLEIAKCEFLERVHGISRLRRLKFLTLLDCPKLVEIGGLAQPPESLEYLRIENCDSIQGLPRLFDSDFE